MRLCGWLLLPSRVSFQRNVVGREKKSKGRRCSSLSNGQRPTGRTPSAPALHRCGFCHVRCSRRKVFREQHTAHEPKKRKEEGEKTNPKRCATHVHTDGCYLGAEDVYMCTVYVRNAVSGKKRGAIKAHATYVVAAPGVNCN